MELGEQIARQEYAAYLSKQTGITKERFLNDPNFDLVRRNAAEFGNASKTGAAFVRSISQLLKFKATSREVLNKVTQRMKQALNFDTALFGERKVTVGGLMTIAPLHLSNQLSTIVSVNHNVQLFGSSATGAVTGIIEFGDMNFFDITWPDGATKLVIAAHIGITNTPLISYQEDTNDVICSSNLKEYKYEITRSSGVVDVAEMNTFFGTIGNSPLPANPSEYITTMLLLSAYFVKTISGVDYVIRDKKTSVGSIYFDMYNV